MRALWGRLRRRLSGRQPLETVAVRQAYDQWARSYGKGTNELQDLEAEVTAQALPESVAGLQVLDAGCGTGRWTEHLSAAGAGRVVGVDLSPGMLAHHTMGGDLIAGSLECLPLAEARFDLVISPLVLGHLPSLGAAYRELCRVLKPQGVLVVSDFHPAAAAAGWKRTFPLSAGDRSEASEAIVEHHTHQIADYRDGLRHAGLTVDHYSEREWRGVPVVFSIRASR